MNFLAPAAFIFAAAIPVVILLYLLKRKRVVRLVSSTLLWQKFLAEMQANAPFQRLRHNWLLLLQLLLLILAILALARPYFAGKSADGALLVVILDASASMQSTDESPSRFEKARAEALHLVTGMKDSDQMVVLLAGAQTEVKQSPTSEKSALRRVLQACAVTDSPTRLAEALKLADTLIQNRSQPEIHLFSDGAIPDLEQFQNRALPVVYHRLGKRGENAGIVALDVRAHPEDPSRRAIFTSIANRSSQPRPVEVELRFNGELFDVRPVTIGAGEISPQVFMAEQSVPGVFTIRLNHTDDLAADNEASVLSLLPQPVKVLLVTRGNRFLERALRGAPHVALSVVSDLSAPAQEFDLVVLDDVAPSVWPAGNVLAIHTAPPEWFENVGRLENPAIVDWKHGHPLLRFTSLENIQISETLAVSLPRWGVALAEAPQTPLIVAGERDRQRVIWIGFDTLQSTWPLRVSFPIFMANAVDWLNPASQAASQLAVRAGEPFRLGLTKPVQSAEIILPDGKTRALEVDPDAREIVFGDTARQGVYRVRAGGAETIFCVNLLDAAETDTQPREELQFGKYEIVSATTLRKASAEWWRWLVAAALGVLLFEWWFYHRRTA